MLARSCVRLVFQSYYSLHSSRANQATLVQHVHLQQYETFDSISRYGRNFERAKIHPVAWLKNPSRFGCQQVMESKRDSRFGQGIDPELDAQIPFMIRHFTS